MEVIEREMRNLKEKKIIIFFKYPNINYLIKKSGKLLECDHKFFILDEIKDGITTYSYEFVVEAREEIEV